MFAIQDEVAAAVAAALGVAFGFGEAAPAPAATTPIEAYDKYLRGRALLHHGGPAELRRAIEILREALALDPDFVPAWHGLYTAHQHAIAYAAESTEKALEGMEEAAKRIVALTPDAWWSHALRANQFMDQHRWAEAEAAAAAALAAAPASEADVALNYSFFVGAVGRYEEMITYTEHARRADPLWLMTSTMAQWVLETCGHLEEADAEYERSKDLPGDRAFVEMWALFRALLRGDVVAARNLASRYAAHQTLQPTGLEDLPEIFDQPETMLARLRQVQVDPANQGYRQYAIALWAAWHGDTALAIAALRRYVSHPPGHIAAVWARSLSSARRTPAFKELVRDLGLVEYWRRSGKWGEFARPVGDDDFEIIK